MTEITVSRGLAELHLLDKKIRKTIEKAKYIAVKTKTKSLDVSKFKIEAKSDLQSINDLIKRKNMNKGSVRKNNAVTTVKIGKNEYTVADAIERKQSIQYEKILLSSLQQQRSQLIQQLNKHELAIKNKLDRLLEVEFGKDVKSNVDNVNSITQSYLENNNMEYIDPIDIDSTISQLENSINEFESEVDLVLVESNAITKIILSD